MEKERLDTWIEQVVGAFEEGDCFLVDLDWKPSSNKMVIYVDSEEELSLGRCQKLSRHIENKLDTSGIIGLEYSLDVSSPGLDRPLKLRRQYKKNVGRVIRVIRVDGNVKIGRLVSINEDVIKLQIEIDRGKKRKPEYGKEIEIDINQIDKTFVEIRF